MFRQKCSEWILPSIFRGGSRYVVKFNFPTNTLFIRLHGDDFACIPLLIDTYFNQQTFIWRRKCKGKKKIIFQVLYAIHNSIRWIISPFWAFLLSFSGSCCWDLSGTYKKKMSTTVRAKIHRRESWVRVKSLTTLTQRGGSEWHAWL